MDSGQDQADNLGRNSPGHAESEKVFVLGDQYESVPPGPLPDRGVTGATQSDQSNMAGMRKLLDQQRQQALRKVFIQQQLWGIHADRFTPMLSL